MGSQFLLRGIKMSRRALWVDQSEWYGGRVRRVSRRTISLTLALRLLSRWWHWMVSPGMPWANVAWWSTRASIYIYIYIYIYTRAGDHLLLRLSIRAELKVTDLRWLTPICGFLCFSAEIFGFLQDSARERSKRDDDNWKPHLVGHQMRHLKPLFHFTIHKRDNTRGISMLHQMSFWVVVVVAAAAAVVVALPLVLICALQPC